MDDDPERRIAELGPARAGLTADRVHNATFSDASRSQGAYDRDEVDAFLTRVAATLRDPTAPGVVTAADIENVVFSKPPMGRMGYSEGEVDLFLDRVKIELTGPTRHEPFRCLLYPYGSRDQQTPARVIDMDDRALRVTDLRDNTLIASVSLAAITATPANDYGRPVLVLDGPGLETLAIAPHPPPGVWRQTPKSREPGYLAVDAEWLTLAERFGLASELADEAEQSVTDHLWRFFSEGATDRGPTTWRTAAMVALLAGVPGVIYGVPFAIVVGVVALIVAVLAWRFKWQI